MRCQIEGHLDAISRFLIRQGMICSQYKEKRQSADENKGKLI